MKRSLESLSHVDAKALGAIFNGVDKSTSYAVVDIIIIITNTIMVTNDFSSTSLYFAIIIPIKKVKIYCSKIL